MIEKHEEKKCPRCNEPFTCKVGDVQQCQCTTVTLSDETREFLSKSYYDCLCKNCLAAINQQVKIASGHTFPNQRELLVEGLHYYKENRAWVFTELYHYLRGECCNNGCRHCVYGFNKPG